MKVLLAFALAAACAAQAPDSTQEKEAEELRRILAGNTSSAVDLIRTLEDYLEKRPSTSLRAEIEQILVRSAIELKDMRRLALYGERVLERTPDDLRLLDSVIRALVLSNPDRAQASKILTYAARFEENLRGLTLPPGPGMGKKKDELDRGIAGALVFQARAHLILGKTSGALAAAGKSFDLYPSAEAAREMAAALEKLDRPKEALVRLAEAFSVIDPSIAPAERAADRRKLGDLYARLHGSETGLGDLILDAYDRMTQRHAERRLALRSLDANSGVTDPMEFTVLALDGSKLALASLKGKIVVMDFWATWCKPCWAQYPLYQQIKARFRDRKDVEFLSINTDEDRQFVAPFLEQNGWSRNVYFEDGLARLLEITAIPTTVVFGKRGQVASRINGFPAGSFVEQLTSRIEAALQEH